MDLKLCAAGMSVCLKCEVACAFCPSRHSSVLQRLCPGSILPMPFDMDMIAALYKSLPAKVEAAREMLGRPMTLAEKILYSHLHPESPLRNFERGKDYVFFSPDRVAMQDATAQMALLQFMMAGKDKVAVPSTVHCDHLIHVVLGCVVRVVFVPLCFHAVFHEHAKRA